MKKTLLIIGGIGLVCFLLVVRLFYKQNSGFESEREWFTKALRYEFSAKVDSIHMLNEHTGKLWCHLTSGDPKIHREDSLKRLFKEHDMLYFVFKRSAETVTFLLPNAELIEKSDSIVVSSEKNSVQLFRDGKQISGDQLSKVLTGFGKPFFLKKK